MNYRLSTAERLAVKLALYDIIDINFKNHKITREQDTGMPDLTPASLNAEDKDVHEILVPFEHAEHGTINIHVLVGHNVWSTGPGRPKKNADPEDRKKTLRTTYYDAYKATKDTLAVADQVTDDPLAGAEI